MARTGARASARTCSYVYERLGKTLYDLDQRRWRADCFHVPSLKRYCELGVADRVVDALKRQTRGDGSKLWTHASSSLPLLPAANRTAILRRDDLEIVDPAKVHRGLRRAEPENFGAFREQEQPADARDAKGGRRPRRGAGGGPGSASKAATRARAARGRGARRRRLLRRVWLCSAMRSNASSRARVSLSYPHGGGVAAFAAFA